MSARSDKRVQRALNRLARDESRILPAPDGYAVFPGGDRRRRASARLTAEDVRGLVADGAIEAQGEGYVLSRAGAARLRREESEDDAFRRQHQNRATRWVIDADGDLAEKEADLGATVRMRLSSHSGRLAISQRAAAAGERLRQDWEEASSGPRITMDWSGVPAGRGRRAASSAAGGMHAGASRAERRARDALAMLGPELAPVVRAFCGEGRTLAAIEAEFRWPRRSARLVLSIALEKLADYYGLMREP